MKIIVELNTSPEGTQGLQEGSQGEVFQVLSSVNCTKVDIVTPKGERFTVLASDLIKAIECCSPEMDAIVWGYGQTQSGTNTIYPSTPSTFIPWNTTPVVTCNTGDGTCACTNVGESKI